MTQTEQVINKMREMGGFSTFGRLNSKLDFSNWKTKTPEATVRRIVQDSVAFFKIKPGLWALEECRENVLKKLGVGENNKEKEDSFSHTYFQGLAVEIGNMKGWKTYVPSQDKNRRFLDKPLKEIVALDAIYRFANDRLQKRASTVDVIWFNEREMPSCFIEIEHSTDIQNSLLKYYDLQDFYANFIIVADEARRKLFDNIIGRSVYAPIKSRVKFVNYERVSAQHDAMYKLSGNMSI
ncbi:MAG: hypothetical protein LBG69_03830 [Zoogloeaceae bacterium]|jgi:hypothetical protein|nr:hypothetical protein [Zoogloeaceae bacterium]